ncbi:MAG: hypothetical protein AB1480_13365 [Nitrospirota bacterium]
MRFLADENIERAVVEFIRSKGFEVFYERRVSMTSKVEKLAAEISALDEHEQQALLERMAELNYHRRLYSLSEQYRERLRSQGELDRSVEEILAELKRVREEVAAHDYPG